MLAPGGDGIGPPAGGDRRGGPMVLGAGSRSGGEGVDDLHHAAGPCLEAQAP